MLNESARYRVTANGLVFQTCFSLKLNLNIFVVLHDMMSYLIVNFALKIVGIRHML